MTIDLQVGDIQALSPGLDSAMVQRLIDGTLARAALVAPCLAVEGFAYEDAAKAVLVDVVLRRAETGTGVVQSEAAGPMSRTYFSSARALFWPAEVAELQALCALAAEAGDGGAAALPVYAMPDPDPAVPS